MPILDRVELAPADPILGLTEAFQADERAEKVNLGVGVYLGEDGKLPLMDAVREAEQRLAATGRPHGYLGIDGMPSYNAATKDLVFGAGSDVVASGRVTTVQTLGGTGALKVAADFMRTVDADAPVYISSPSWENHRALFTRAGYEVKEYRYYSPQARGIDFEGMLADLNAAPAGAIVVLHACCHNPTGYDLDPGQWDQVIALVAERGLVALVDMAYQGFGFGIAEDGAVIGKFVDAGLEFIVTTSFSKSFSLYGERVGALHVVSRDAETARKVLSQVKICVRTNYSNPATHGAALVDIVLADPELRERWASELSGMRNRIKSLRGRLVQGLREHGVDDMGFINEQLGMFSYSGLTRDQMVALRTDHGVYGTDSGRMCVAALNSSNVDYVARAIAAVR